MSCGVAACSSYPPKHSGRDRLRQGVAYTPKEGAENYARRERASTASPGKLDPRGQTRGLLMERKRIGRWLFAVIPLLLGIRALMVLHDELGRYHVADIIQRISALPVLSVVMALGLTALDYCVLVSCDFLALRYARRRLPLRCVALASSASYAVTHLLSYQAVTGGAIRYRLWSRWGLSAADIASGVGFLVVTNLLGILATSGIAISFASRDFSLPMALSAGAMHSLGFFLIAMVVAYVGANALIKNPLSIRGRQVRLPGPALAAAQIGLSAVDWMLAGAVLYALLPSNTGLTFPLFLGAFLVAQGAGILSYVPGGIGVFDTVLVLLMRPYMQPLDAVGALVAYRGLYYFLPFIAAVTTLGAYEFRHHRGRIWRVVTGLRRGVSTILPDLLSAATFVSGAILLISGAMPAIPSRLGWLNGIVPLGIVEVSHFVGSLVGVGLLVLAFGLRRRLDVAYHLTVAGLVLGIVASLLKGADWEEASILTAVLIVLVPSHTRFY